MTPQRYIVHYTAVDENSRTGQVTGSYHCEATDSEAAKLACLAWFPNASIFSVEETKE